MKNIWSVIFARAVVDSNSNSLSLFDSIEEITISFPNPEDVNKPKKDVPINIAIVSLWKDENFDKQRKFDHKIELIDPKGEKISEFINEPIFEIGKKRLRTIVNMSGMSVTSEGEYNVIIKYRVGNGSFVEVAKIPIDIKYILNTPIKNKSKN